MVLYRVAAWVLRYGHEIDLFDPQAMFWSAEGTPGAQWWPVSVTITLGYFIADTFVMLTHMDAKVWRICDRARCAPPKPREHACFVIA